MTRGERRKVTEGRERGERLRDRGEERDRNRGRGRGIGGKTRERPER